MFVQNMQEFVLCMLVLSFNNTLCLSEVLEATSPGPHLAFQTRI